MNNIVILAIMAISSFDVYLNLKYPVTADVELNPIAKFILKESNNDLPLFFAIKFFGNCCAIFFLINLKYWIRKDLYNIVLYSVFGFCLLFLVFVNI